LQGGHFLDDLLDSVFVAFADFQLVVAGQPVEQVRQVLLGGSDAALANPGT
jgi:hypothetical protein